MTIPTDPSHSNPRVHPPIQPGGQQPTPNVDPTGAWSKFLSTSGNVATPQEVQMFMQGILKMFNVIIQQQNASYHRSNEQLKKAIEGQE